MNATFKVDTNETLTPFEDYQITLIEIQRLLNWEWQYEEYVAGFLTEDELPTQTWKIVMAGNYKLRDIWARSKDTRDPEFVRFIEDNILSEN